jgi:dTDP-4-dehydrorhamnose reductase
MSRAEAPPLLILGATGRLGQAFARACELRNLRHVPTARAEIDVRDEAGIDRALDRHEPWAVVNATGWAGIDDAEDAPEACYETNTHAPVRLARAAAERGIPTLHVSSDLVFDGRSARPYVESDVASPIGVYGASKARMEDALLAAATALAGGMRIRAAADLVVSPTYVPHLVAAALDLLIDGETGIWHLTHGSAHSWAQFARLIAGRLGLSPSLVEDVSADELGFRARRPRYAALATERGAALPPLEVALSEFASSFSLQTRGAGAQDARVAAESIGQ